MDMNSDFYKNLLDNLYDGVYFVDRERRITYWNKGAEGLTGYMSHEVVGTPCQPLFKRTGGKIWTSSTY